MKRFSQRTGLTSMAELNITPLLDLAFVLLIIFVITTPLLEQSIDVNVPSAESSTLEVAAENVRNVSIDSAGALFLDETRHTPASLETALRELYAVNPKLAIGIRADKGIAFDRVVDVLEILGRIGITQFGLVTQVAESP